MSFDKYICVYTHTHIKHIAGNTDLLYITLILVKCNSHSVTSLLTLPRVPCFNEDRAS